MTHQMVREKKQNLVLKMMEFVGISTQNFPTLRVIKMNNHHFFGRKYREPNDYLTSMDVKHFFDQIVKKKIKPYTKSQEFLPLKHENIKKEEEIKLLQAMIRLHAKNFKRIVEKGLIKFGFFIFVYAEPELCPMCQKYEQMIIENFHKVKIIFLK